MQITIDKLAKIYPGQRVLKSLSLQIPAGKIVALVGVNGVGKSTLLRCLASLVIPDRGEIQFDGELLTRKRLDLRRRLFFLPDTPTVLPNTDLFSHLELVLSTYEYHDPALSEHVKQLIAEFQLHQAALAGHGPGERPAVLLLDR